ncbi:MAG: thiamine pyrophosphate-dependent enzyme, partial [Candidatus Eremiobacteraeota bacterium]|nr:thiamine pyrophosphate-dependent enzyme [Candidatus Eremiobacteraeota bacterium]
GIPGESFNGFDPIQTFDVVRRALDRARTGAGPSLVEGKCYRFLSHSTDDDDRTYRTREEIELQRRQDPVPRFERILIEHNVMTAQEVETLKKAVLKETNDATDRAEAMPYPAAEDLYTNVYEGTWQPWQ